jgi:gluconokinase
MSAIDPILLVVMGVSGCGKSTFAQAISRELSLDFVDGDDLHSPSNVAKMQDGVPLQDEDRWPWLDRVAHYLSGASSSASAEQGAGRVVACSALKRVYRDRIRQNSKGVHFVFLDGDRELIRMRMEARQGHFMRLELLDSQLATLERPTADESDVITIHTKQPIEQSLENVIHTLQLSRC